MAWQEEKVHMNISGRANISRVRKTSSHQHESAPSCPPNQPLTVGAFFPLPPPLKEPSEVSADFLLQLLKGSSQLWCVQLPEMFLSSDLWVKSLRIPEM